MPTNSKIQTCWTYIQNNKLILAKALYLKQTDASCVLELKKLFKAIHPAIDLRPYYGTRDKMVQLYIPMREKAYIYYIAELVRLTQPEETQDLFEVVCGSPFPISENHQLNSSSEPHYLTTVWAKFSESNNTHLLLYSKDVDLYDPKHFYTCREYIGMLFGEAFLEIFLEEIKIIDYKANDAMSLQALRDKHSKTTEGVFPPIPFNPIDTPCRYELGINQTQRQQGTISFAALLRELVTSSEKYAELRYIRAFEEAGISTYSCSIHYPGNFFEAQRTAQALWHNLAQYSNIRQLILPLGSAEARDTYIIDFLCTSPNEIESILQQEAEQANCLVQLTKHNTPLGAQVMDLWEPSRLSIEEMDQRNVSPQDIIQACRRLQPSTKDINIYLIEGRAYNGLEDYDTAIRTFNNCPTEAHDDPRRHYGLAHAYRSKQCKHYEEALSNARIAFAHYQRCVELGHRCTLSYAMMAKICFSLPLEGSMSYQAGRDYLELAQRDKQDFEHVADMFFDFSHSLSKEDEEALNKAYEERFGTAYEEQTVHLASGQKFQILYYNSSRKTKACHIAVTKGLSSILLGLNPKFTPGVDCQFRLEHIIAIPNTISLDELHSPQSSLTWITDCVNQLNRFYINSKDILMLSSLDKVILDFGRDCLHPYEGHSAFRLLLNPTNIFKSASAKEVVNLPSKETIQFIGITPMYNEEYHYNKHHSNTECAQLGLWRISPIYNKSRANLGLTFKLEEIDFDSFTGKNSFLSIEE